MTDEESAELLGTLNRVTEERDQARRIAVRLEQDLARARDIAAKAAIDLDRCLTAEEEEIDWEQYRSTTNRTTPLVDPQWQYRETHP